VGEWISHLENRVQVGHAIEIRCGEVGATTGVDGGFSVSYLLSKSSLHVRVTCELEKNPAKRSGTCFMTCEEYRPSWNAKICQYLKEDALQTFSDPPHLRQEFFIGKFRTCIFGSIRPNYKHQIKNDSYRVSMEDKQTHSVNLEHPCSLYPGGERLLWSRLTDV
jgi:hypothetical protein